MRYFNFKDEKISRLGFGCMRFKTIDNDASKIDKDQSSQIIKEAIDKGLTYIDTAYPYHEKMSEKFVGEFHDEYEAFEEIIKSYDWDFCQIQLNYLDVNLQAGLKGYELAKEMGIPVIIMEPVKGGRLANPPQEVKDLLADFTDLTPAQQAIKFPLSLDNVMTVLSGMNDIDQVRENIEIASADPTLTEKEKEFYDKARKIYKSREQINVEQCFSLR